MSLLDSLKDLFKTIFGGLTSKQKKIVAVSGDIVNAIKKLPDNDQAPMELVLSVIPDNLREKFAENIVSILFDARLIDSKDLTPAEAIKAAAERIELIKGSLNHKVSLNNLGIFLTSVLADGKIRWDDLVHIPKLFYSHQAEVLGEPKDTDGDGIPDNEDDDADGDGIHYLTDPNDPRNEP